MAEFLFKLSISCGGPRGKTVVMGSVRLPFPLFSFKKVEMLKAKTISEEQCPIFKRKLQN